MKRNRNHITILFLLSVTLLVLSCGDEKEFFQDVTLSQGARIKFIHAASDTVGVNFFIDNVKISGGGTSIIPATQAVNIGTIGYQSAFPITNYVTVPSTSEVEIIVPTVYQASDTFFTKTILKKAIATNAESHYSIAFVGITGAYDAVLIEDDFSIAPTDEQTYIRFANFIHNSTDKLTLKATPPATTANPTPTPITLFSNVEYKGVTPFIALPTTGTYTNVRIYNAATDALVATLTTAGSSTFSGNNVYTIFARGQIGGTGPRVPGVTRITNR